MRAYVHRGQIGERGRSPYETQSLFGQSMPADRQLCRAHKSRIDRTDGLHQQGGEALSSGRAVRFSREVQRCELAMMPHGRPVVGLGRLDFGGETTEANLHATNGDGRDPASRRPAPHDAFVGGGKPPASILRTVAHVLRWRRGSQVGLAIVPAFLIDVIDQQALARREHLPVHGDPPALAIAQRDGTGRIVRPSATRDVPFVLGQSRIVVGIDDGVFPLGQRYPSEGVPMPEPAIDQHQPDTCLAQPERNGQRDLDNQPRRKMQRSNIKHQN